MREKKGGVVKCGASGRNKTSATEEEKGNKKPEAK